MSVLQKGAKKAKEAKSGIKRILTEFEMAMEEAQRNAALPVEQGGLGLPPDNTAMDRAKAMNKDIPMFHATDKDIEAFDNENFTHRGATFLTPSVKFANKFRQTNPGTNTNIMPLLYDKGKQFDYENLDDVKSVIRNISDDDLDFEFRGIVENNLGIKNGEASIGQIEMWLADRISEGDWQYIENPVVRDAILSNGYDSFTVKEWDTKNVGVFDDSRIRSIYAAFDPMKRNSSNLLAGAGAGVATMVGSRQPSEEDRRQSAIDKMVRQMAYGEGWQ